MTLSLPGRAVTVTAALLIVSAGASGTALAAGKGSAQRPAVKATSCTGDTVSTSVVLTGTAGSHYTARLLSGPNQGHMVPTGQQTDIVLAAGTSSYAITFDIAGRADKMYRVDVVDAAGGRLAASRSLPAASCAPGTEVPEAPAALLVPVSLLATFAVAARKRIGARP